MELVKAKKHLGQHFLKDLNIAQKIADTLSLKGYKKVIEIGAGMGVLTQFLLKKDVDVHIVEIDKESVAYLETHYPELKGKIIDVVEKGYKLGEKIIRYPKVVVGQ